MAKLHDTESERPHDRLRSRIRELTDECRRLREELRKSTQDRIAGNPMANDRNGSAFTRGRKRKSEAQAEMSDLEKDTIVIDRRDGLWRMRMYPGTMQLFRSRELAEAHAQELACAQIPRWTVIVREGEGGS